MKVIILVSFQSWKTPFMYRAIQKNKQDKFLMKK